MCILYRFAQVPYGLSKMKLGLMAPSWALPLFVLYGYPLGEELQASGPGLAIHLCLKVESVFQKFDQWHQGRCYGDHCYKGQVEAAVIRLLCASHLGNCLLPGKMHHIIKIPFPSLPFSIKPITQRPLGSFPLLFFFKFSSFIFQIFY